MVVGLQYYYCKATPPPTMNPVAELLLLLLLPPLPAIRDDSINHDNPSIPAIIKLVTGPIIAILNSFGNRLKNLLGASLQYRIHHQKQIILFDVH